MKTKSEIKREDTYRKSLLAYGLRCCGWTYDMIATHKELRSKIEGHDILSRERIRQMCCKGERINRGFIKRYSVSNLARIDANIEE